MQQATMLTHDTALDKGHVGQITREKMASILGVLNKIWLTRGWKALDPQDSEPMALAWLEALDDAKVDFRYYNELYLRALKLRSRKISEGLEVPDLCVELLVSLWPELQREIRDRLVKTARYLEDATAADCPRCFGSGWETIPGQGARVCDHKTDDTHS